MGFDGVNLDRFAVQLEADGHRMRSISARARKVRVMYRRRVRGPPGRGLGAFVERQHPVREVVQALLELVDGRQRGALATVVRAVGSTPQKAGARLVLQADGTTVGTVGGGAIEHAVLRALAEVIRTGESHIVAHDLGHDLGMCCGGRMDVFVEPIEPAPRLVAMGAGHVAQATAVLARGVGFRVAVVDDRDELNTAERFPGCEIVLEEPPSFLHRAAAEGRALGRYDWVLIATHDHALDEQTLASSLEQGPAYIGLVASRRKALRLVQRIAARRGPAVLERINRFLRPGGSRSRRPLAAGDRPQIMAEVVALRHGQDVSRMRSVGRGFDDPRLVRTLEGGAPTRPPRDGRPLEARRGTRRERSKPGDHPAEHTALDRLAERIRRDLDVLDYPRRQWLEYPENVGGPTNPRCRRRRRRAGWPCGRVRADARRVPTSSWSKTIPSGKPVRGFALRGCRRCGPQSTSPVRIGHPEPHIEAGGKRSTGKPVGARSGANPKEAWAAYLTFYRETLGIPLRAETRVGALRWDARENAWRVPCSSADAARRPAADVIFARRVVLATGIDGSGTWYLPGADP